MNLDFQAGKTPLTSRQNPVIYVVILIAALIALILLGLRVLQILRKKKIESPEFIEKEKKRPTKKSDCYAFVKKYNLDPAYIPVLWYTCSKFQIPNINYSIKTFDQLDNCFKEAYLSLKKENEENKINILFKLKFELDSIFATSVVYSSTHTIPLKTKLKLILKKNIAVSTTIAESNKNYLALEVPLSFLESKYKPEEMDRIGFTFISQTGLPYTFITRFIRWQNQGDKTLMIVNHTHQLLTKTQRNFKRINISIPCQYSSIKVKKNENGEKINLIGEKKYTGQITNISGGGCCLTSNLPITEGQIIQIDFALHDQTISTPGKIVKLRKTQQPGIYNLHIQFLKIDNISQNLILAKVYAYD